MGKFVRKKDVVSGRLADELVMLDIDQGKYFSLNPVSTRIWDLLEEPKTLEDIVAILMEEFEVTESECHSDVEEFLKELVKLKLVDEV